MDHLVVSNIFDYDLGYASSYEEYENEEITVLRKHAMHWIFLE